MQLLKIAMEIFGLEQIMAVSQYNPKTKTWNSFPAESSSGIKDKNKIFITLCEVSPGIIWAGGYSSGFYQIDKRNRSD